MSGWCVWDGFGDAGNVGILDDTGDVALDGFDNECVVVSHLVCSFGALLASLALLALLAFSIRRFLVDFCYCICC